MADEPRTTGDPSLTPLRSALAALGVSRPTQVLPREEPSATFALRPLQPDDRDQMIALVDSCLDHLAPWIPFLGRGGTPAEFFTSELDRTLNEEPRRLSLRRVGVVDSRIVGMFNLFNVSSGLTLQADASWWIARQYTRRGYATQGVRLLLRHAFADLPEGLGLHRVMAMIAPENLASLKLARSLGFRPFTAEDHHVRIGQVWKRHECWIADALDVSLTEVKPPARAIDRASLRSEGD